MEIFRKIAASCVFAVLFVFAFATTAFADATQYGLSVGVTTDKSAYAADEMVQVQVVVENTNLFEVKNVTIENVIPAGLRQTNTVGLKTNKSLAAGERVAFSVTAGLEKLPDAVTASPTTQVSQPASQATKPGSQATQPTSKATGSTGKATSSSSVPKTGDDYNPWIWIVLLAGSAAALVLMLKYRNGSTKALSLFMCVAVLLATVQVVSFAEEPRVKTFTTTKTFRVGSSDYVYKVVVSYEENPEAASFVAYNFDSFHTASLDRAGDSTVNDFSGNLTHTLSDISMTGNRLPIEIDHIFDLLGDDVKGMKFGRGWRLSVLEQIIATGLENYPYRFIDSDGVSYYFKRALRENGPDVDGNPFQAHSFVERNSEENDPDVDPWGFREELDDAGQLIGFTMFYPDFSEYFYNADGYLERAIDPHGVSDRVYTYADGRLTKVTDPAGRAVTFTYDAAGYLMKMTDPSGRSTSYEYDMAKDVLCKVIYPDGSFASFTYNVEGNLTSITDVDGSSLSYEYAARRVSKLTDKGTDSDLDYYLEFVYNHLETVVTDDEGESEVIKFNPDGSLFGKDDGNGSSGGGDEEDTIRNEYNSNKDLIKTEEKDESGVWKVTYAAEYDQKHHLLWKISDEVKTSYTYDRFFNVIKQQTQKAVQSASVSARERSVQSVVSVAQDVASVEEWEYSSDGNYVTKYVDIFGYAVGRQGSETSRVSELQNPGKNTSFGYEYDANGNIVAIKDQRTGVQKVRYSYDGLSQLIREDNAYAGKSYLYEYDNSGNITAKKSYAYSIAALGVAQDTVNYSYGVSSLPGWNDVLSGFDGKEISYDVIGNPLTYDGYSFSWENGRQLAGMSGGGSTVTYKYNGDGIRVQKTADGVVTDYVVDESGNIRQEKTGSASKVFEYDADGKLLSMKHDGAVYYYILNLQGDVVGLLDSTGTQVAEYAYDAWGNVVSKSGSAADINPFGYRGYYQDVESGMYYLQSRYYNPQWGRFLNADTLFDNSSGLAKTNLFCYVGNNPVMYVDPSGHTPANVIGALIGAVAGAVGGYFVTNLVADYLHLSGALRNAFVWGLTGVLTATVAAIGFFVGPYVGAAISGLKFKLLGLIKHSYKSVRISDKNMAHINGTKHLWDKVLPKGVTSEGIKKRIHEALAKGEWEPHKNREGVFEIEWKYGNEIIDVSGQLEGKVFKVSDAWVRDKTRNKTGK